MKGKRLELLLFSFFIIGGYLVFYFYAKLSENRPRFSYYIDGIIAGLVILFVITTYGGATFFSFRKIGEENGIYKVAYMSLFLASAGLFLYFFVPTVFVVMGYIQYHYFSWLLFSPGLKGFAT